MAKQEEGTCTPAERCLLEQLGKALTSLHNSNIPDGSIIGVELTQDEQLKYFE
jgi:hypothetical protein